MAAAVCPKCAPVVARLLEDSEALAGERLAWIEGMRTEINRTRALLELATAELESLRARIGGTGERP